MSDDGKKKTGFAANPGGINRRGRPVGSKNKLPSDPALKELLKKNAPEAIQTIIGIMRDGDKDETRLKAAVKVVDMTYNIVLNDEKLESKPTPEGEGNKPKPRNTGMVINMTAS